MLSLLRLGIVILILSILSYLFWQIVTKMHRQDVLTKQIAVLQQIPYTALSGRQANITKGKPTLIIFFNSTCEHCQSEMEALRKQSHNFRDIALYFISTEDLPTIKIFAKRYKLIDAFPHARIGSMRIEDTVNYFGVTSYPMTYVYQADGQLIKRYKGQVSPQLLLQSLKHY